MVIARGPTRTGGQAVPLSGGGRRMERTKPSGEGREGFSLRQSNRAYRRHRCFSGLSGCSRDLRAQSSRKCCRHHGDHDDPTARFPCHCSSSCCRCGPWRPGNRACRRLGSRSECRARWACHSDLLAVGIGPFQATQITTLTHSHAGDEKAHRPFLGTQHQ